MHDRAAPRHMVVLGVVTGRTGLLCNLLSTMQFLRACHSGVRFEVRQPDCYPRLHCWLSPTSGITGMVTQLALAL